MPTNEIVQKSDARIKRGFPVFLTGTGDIWDGDTLLAIWTEQTPNAAETIKRWMQEIERQGIIPLILETRKVVPGSKEHIALVKKIERIKHNAEKLVWGKVHT